MRVPLGCAAMIVLACAAAPGCGPSVSDADLGRIVFEVPEVPGAEEPYEFPPAPDLQGAAAGAPGQHASPAEQRAWDELSALLPDPASPAPPTSQAALEEARRLAEWLQARFPDDAEAQDLAAGLLLWVGDSTAAMACWERCLQLDPGHATAYRRLGLMAAKRADYEKAAELLRKAVELRPKLPLPQIDLATALMSAGRMDEAIAVLDKYVGTSVDPSPGLILLGRAHLNLGNWREAKDHYEAFVKLRPQISDGHFGLATACARLGEMERAKEEMAKFRVLKLQEEGQRKAQLGSYSDLHDLWKTLATAYAGAAEICARAASMREALRPRRRAEVLASQLPSGLPGERDLPSPTSHRQ